MKWSF